MHEPFEPQCPTPPATAALFPDLRPALTRQAALPEANRCLFCFDAPCMQACPTHIDVPRFIKKIATGNLQGSAQTILDANILGGSCSRACPVEVLCEGACVLNHYDRKPSRSPSCSATRWTHFHAANEAALHARTRHRQAHRARSAPARHRSHARPSCAATATRPTIYDARPLPGGLNTYGIAEYKLPLAESCAKST